MYVTLKSRKVFFILVFKLIRNLDDNESDAYDFVNDNNWLQRDFVSVSILSF